MTIRADAHKPDFHRAAPPQLPVRCATTGSITIATGLNAGDTIDGITLATGDRVLVKDQGDATNGIYIVGASPARAFDFEEGTAAYGAVINVVVGTANASTQWRCTNTTVPTIGSTTLTFAQITGGSLTVADEGTPLATSATTLDFTGTGVTASGSGATKTINIPGGGTPTFHGAKGTNTAGTSINTGTPTAMPLASEEFDTDAYHDNSSNNSRLTVPTGLGGKYLVTGQLTFSGANFAGVYALIRKNGTTDLAYTGRTGQEASVPSGYNLSVIVTLAQTDYVELIVHQASGSGKTLEAAAGYNWLAATLLGP